MSEAPTNLAPERTDFVGRAPELEHLGALLAAGARLVTITGPGGSGKTRLARELGRRLAGAGGFDGGVWFCDLTNAREAGDLVAGVASALGIRLDAPGASSERVLGALRAGRRRLIVLDNCEGLSAPGREPIAGWLDRAPEACFVVTSRERVRLRGEHVLALGPLALPTASGASDLETLLAADAVALFVRRARAARASFAVTPADGPLLAELVRALDGLPLAIELCAARASSFGVRELLDGMKERFELLVADTDDAPARHASLRAAFEGSWSLLEPAERRALASATLFRGGFDLEAVAAVVADPADGSRRASVRAIVESLASKSLLRVDEARGVPGETRFALLESLRAYCAEELDPDDGAIDRYVAHFAELTETWAGRVHGPVGVEAVARLVLETENLLAAHEHALARAPGEPAALEAAHRILRGLEQTLGLGCPVDRFIALVGATLGAPGAGAVPEATRARALAARGGAHHLRGDWRSSRDDYAAALATAETTGDTPTRIVCLVRLATLSGVQSAPAEAEAMFEQARALLARQRDGYLEGFFWQLHGTFRSRAGDNDAGLGAFIRARDAFRAIGARRDEGLILGWMANRYYERGALSDARSCLAPAIEMARDTGDRRLESFFVACAGEVELEEGRRAEARRLLDHALRLQDGAADAHVAGLVRTRMGTLELEEGRLDRAREELEHARRLLDECGDRCAAAVVRARQAIAEALAGAIDAARTSLAEAQATLEAAGAREVFPALALYQAHEALIAAPRGDAAARSEAIAAAEGAVAASNALPPHDETRLARRLLRRSLAALEGRPGTAQAARPEPPQRALAVGTDARWFRTAGGEPVDLSRSRAPRLVLCCLVERRLATPGGGVSLDELLAAGWPGTRVGVEAGYPRVYTAIRTLRRAGLEGVLLTHDDGYLLDPSIPVERAGDSHGPAADAEPRSR